MSVKMKLGAISAFLFAMIALFIVVMRKNEQSAHDRSDHNVSGRFAQTKVQEPGHETRRVSSAVISRLMSLEQKVKDLSALAKDGSTSRSRGNQKNNGSNREFRSVEEKIAFYDSHFREEPRDPFWADKTEVRIEESIKSPLLEGVLIEDAKCKSSLCRVNLSIDEDIDIMHSLKNIDSAPPFSEGPASVYVDDPANRHVVYFFARRGHSLPIKR